MPDDRRLGRKAPWIDPRLKRPSSAELRGIFRPRELSERRLERYHLHARSRSGRSADEPARNRRSARSRSGCFRFTKRAGRAAELIETLLRGRSTLRILELERLCTRFFDHPADRIANVKQILVDGEIITLADDDAEKPRYPTTRRIHALVTQAADLIDNSSEGQIATITAADRVFLVRRIAFSKSTRTLCSGRYSGQIGGIDTTRVRQVLRCETLAS